MVRDNIDILLAIVQIITLIALIIYVVKTWEIASASKKSTKVSEGILKEMKESRDTEIAPYVVVYFDIPYGKHLIHLVVKNVGKSVAENVKLAFQPPLKNSDGELINDISLIKEGIGSMPPGYEIRTFFDSTISYLGRNELPLIYKVNVSYSGGLHSDTRNIEQIMDLSAFKDISFISDNGMHELVIEVKNLVKHNQKIGENLKKIADYSADGIWLKNPDFFITGLQFDSESWTSNVLAKLIEFKILWMSVYGEKHEKIINPFLADLKNGSAIIGSQLLIMASNTPLNIPSEIMDHLVEIAVKLSELGRARFYMGGGKSINDFDTSGNQIIIHIDEIIEKIKKQTDTLVNSEKKTVQ